MMQSWQKVLAAWVGTTALTLVELGGCLAVGTAGCSAEYWTGRIEPVTDFSISPFTKTAKLHDTKNNDILIEGLEYDAVTHQFRLDRLTIVNKSSDVIAADAARMELVAKTMQIQVDYQRQLGQNVAVALAAGGEAANRALSFLHGAGVDWGSGGMTLGGAEPVVEPEKSKDPPPE